MPDVSRSDSQRSDASQRPRVSFNRDVHVKRIGNPGAPRVVGALAGDGEGHLVSLPVRRERPTRLSRRELAKEAQRVLHQADRIACTSTSLLEPGNKARFSTLPPLRSNHKHRRRNKSLSEDSPASSLDRNIKHKNPLASVFYSLDRSRTKKNNKLTNGHAEKSILSKKNSSSLSDLLQTSSSSPERINSFKTKRTKLVRSASDSGKSSKSSSPDKTKNFLSLRRNKTRKSRSDYSDTSPSPPLRGIKKKKSHSDSEAPLQFLVPDTVQVEGNVKKKQLSPIIEASPKEDYFEGKRCAVKNINRGENKVTDHKRGGLVSSEDTMHSSQVTPKPVLTRGRNVDVMVKRLSQDTKLGRGPPRHLNTAVGLVTPGEERQHNNNLPFSYTKSTPTAHDRAAPRGGVSKLSDGVVAGRPAAPTDGQVIYAEVVVSGGSGNGTLNKQTIHTQVPTDRRSNKDPAPQPPKLKSEPVQVSDEDEGLGLTMDYGNGYRRSSAEYLESEIKSYGKKGFRMGDDSLGNDYSTEMNGYKGKQREYTSFGGQDKFGINNNNNLKNSSRLVRVDYGKDMTGSVSKKEYVVHESSRYESGDYIMDPPGRGRADGMDSWKKESMLENYERYEDDFPRRKERDSNMSPIRMVDDYVGNKGFKTEYRSESRFSKDEVDNDRHYRRSEVKHDPLIEPQIINRNDLSLRRDRLQSRIESKSTERLINSRLQQEKRDVLDSKGDDSNKKYPSDTRIPSSDAAFHNRREFLNSQINFDKIPIKSDARYENEKSYANNSRFIESIATETDSYSRKDILADSGIEVDYRKDSTGTMGHSAYDDNLINKGHLSPSKPKVTLNGRQPHNVSKVDLNGHSKERISDSEDVVENNQYHHGSNRNTSYSKQTTSDSFMSTRLVKEQKKTTEAIPSSTVLIRHYAPSNKESTTDLRSNSKYQNLSHVNTDPQEEQMDLKEWNTKEQLREEERNENDELKKNESTKKEGKKKENKQKESEKKEEIKTVPKKKPVTTMDKMRQLFSRGDTKTLKKNKKDDKVKGGKMKKGEDEREDPLTSRYSEYKGSNMVMNESTPRSSSRLQQQRNFSSDMEDDNAAEELGRSRQRLATPSPSPSPLRTHESMTTLTRINNEKNKENNWFKSLDRLTKKNKSKAKIDNIKEATTEDEMQTRSKHNNLNSSSNKSLRFFGDTDQESVKSAIKHQPIRRYKSNNTTVNSNKLQVPQHSSSGGLRNHHRHHRSAGDVATSSAESTTEGDSSQQSQRSVVYLHAATVGDIPGPGLGAKSQRRAQSREELSSVASSRLQPQTRTVSRSISVLAPWKPKHYREGMDVHYDNESSGRGNGKPPKVPATSSSTINRGTARRRNDETARPSFQKQKVNKAMSVESLSHRDSPLGTRNQNKDTSSSKKRNLSTSVESLTYKNEASTRNQQNKVASKKSNMLNSSAIDRNSNKSYKNGSSRKIIEGKKASSNLNRSASMPKDTRTSGWFKLRNKK